MYAQDNILCQFGLINLSSLHQLISQPILVHFLVGIVSLFGDNRSVVTSATLPHSTLTKRHNILAFHRVREAIAAKLMAFYWIQSAYNLSDMLSKHCDHPSVYPMILKLLITRGNITLIPREATQEKEKEILNPQKEKLKIEEKQNKNMK